MPNTREKLIELLENCVYENVEPDDGYVGFDVKYGNIADHLIAHGVTVQDGKPLEEFLHPIDAYKGLKEKYLVFKADTRKKVDNCFVLRPDRDPAATEALRAYANATDNETLAEDIYNWVGKGEKVQEWISVKDRLPEQNIRVLVWMQDNEEEYTQIDTDRWSCTMEQGYQWIRWGKRVTHWMPLPQPPKGE